MKTTARRAARLLAIAGGILLIAFSAALLLSPTAQARTRAREESEFSIPGTEEPEEENEAGMIILGVLVFLGGGAFFGWVIWRLLKHTIRGTVAHVEVLKEAAAGAKEEIKIANERKKNGQGWTLPPDYARNNASQPLAQAVPANGEAVSGVRGLIYEDMGEQDKADADYAKAEQLEQ
jgi:hypothetical protein